MIDTEATLAAAQRILADAWEQQRATPLVVDTGMHALGWSLQRARDYLRAHSAMSEAEIRSESLRHACDMPAQALACKLGDEQIQALRERVRAKRGAAFDLRDFHADVLRHGASPLPDLCTLVEREAA